MDFCDRAASCVSKDIGDLWAIEKELIFDAINDEIKLNVSKSSSSNDEVSKVVDDGEENVND